MPWCEYEYECCTSTTRTVLGSRNHKSTTVLVLVRVLYTYNIRLYVCEYGADEDFRTSGIPLCPLIEQIGYYVLCDGGCAVYIAFSESRVFQTYCKYFVHFSWQCQAVRAQLRGQMQGASSRLGVSSRGLHLGGLYLTFQCHQICTNEGVQVPRGLMLCTDRIV